MSVTQPKRDLAAQLLGMMPTPAGEADWARAARAAARARLETMGGPIRRDEYWKYTDPARLTVAMAPAPAAAPGALAPVFGGLEAAEVVFVNGRRAGGNVDGLNVDDVNVDGLNVGGASITALSRALAAGDGFARDLFGVLEAAGQEKVARPLAALNTALAAEGLVIRVTGKAARPIHVRQVQAGEGASLLRHLVRVEAGAELTLLESGAASNTCIEIDIADGGVVHHVRVQTGPRTSGASHVFARLGAGAMFKTFTLSTDGALTRNEVVVDLVGDHAVAHAAGAVLAGGEAHVDNTVFVTHSGEHGESRQVYRMVLDGRARSVFQGKIFVRAGAQKTDGYQISKAILLSPTAEFDAKPELEIHADDVVCSHGSTTGAMDEIALFYLRGRGVPRAQAEALLVAAFADEALAEIDDPAAAGAMRGVVADWMARRAV